MKILFVRRVPSLGLLPSAVLACALLLGGCASNPVAIEAQREGRDLARLQASAITDPGSLSVHSRQVIRVMALEETWEKDPRKTLEILRAAAADESVPSWQRILAIAELCYSLADRTPDEREAQALFLEAVTSSVLGLRQVGSIGSLFDPRHRLMAEIYNRGLARFIALGERLDGPPETWTRARVADREYEIEIERGDATYDPAAFDELIPAQSFAQRGLKNEFRRFGAGATMVGYRSNLNEKGRIDPIYPPRIIRPVTVTLQMKPSGKLAIAFRNPLRSGTLPTLKGETLTLAADWTAPLAWSIATSDLYKKENLSFFSPEEFAPFTGLYLASDYDPEKIPVVLVHGLWSSPLTWIWLLNEIWGDDDLREHYQVWYYAYPTGLPILGNAATFRRNLLAMRRQLDPEGDDPASRNMVLIGHSMGGLLSKLMVKDIGDRLWNARFKKPLDEIVATPKVKQMLREAFFPQPLPFVKRVIFMAVPHRGSSMADGLIGAIGSALVSLPKDMEKMAEQLARDNKDVFRTGAGLEEGVLNSVDGLSAESPLLAAMNQAPFKPGLPYHSIIGDVDAAGHKGGSDSVVPYSSSHLDGAVSEVIVHNDHSLTGNPAAMKEVRRILRLHLKESTAPSH